MDGVGTAVQDHQRDLNAWLTYLETLHPKAIELGLERCKTVAQEADLLSLSCPVITVGGTNGKGTSVALLETAFLAAGYRVGAYTSPHLLAFNERIRINGIPVDDVSLCNAFVAIETVRGNTSLTYFEFTTLAALWLFKQNALDIVILEVGLGGRLDAVNIIDADVALIATVALDHMEFLGNDREAIGFEKAGIMRPDKPVICGDVSTPQSVRDYAQEIGARLLCQGKDFTYEQKGDTWNWWNQRQQLIGLPLPKIPLQNAAAVLEIFDVLPKTLKIMRPIIEKALQTVRVAGRLQIVEGPVPLILDVAHNPAAAQWLAGQLAKIPCQGRTLAVFSMLADKDQLGTIIPLLDQIDSWFISELNVKRSADIATLSQNLKTVGARNIHEYETIAVAYQAALAQAQPNDRILVFGSFYTVAEVLRLQL